MTASKSEEPVLSEDDEAFLNSITSENPPALPPRPNVADLPIAGETYGNDAQVALLDGADHIPLPETPSEVFEEPTTLPETEQKPKKSRKAWSWMRRDSRDTKAQSPAPDQETQETLKPPEAVPNEDGEVDDEEAKKEEEDMMVILERLNLAAVNNRVFSISDETQELLRKFNLIVKDLAVGAPTAYDDLEKLLTNADGSLQKTFNSLPGFLQKLVQQLPDKMTKGFAPSMMAAAAEKAQKSGINMEQAGRAAGTAKKMGFKAPTLKDMIGKPGAIAGLMRSIIAFLRARFPAFMGMNVLWSLALFGKLACLDASEHLLTAESVVNRLLVLSQTW